METARDAAVTGTDQTAGVLMRTETPEDKNQREYRERTKSISADRLVPYELYSLRLAIVELSANLGKREALIETALTGGLAAIALAAANPADNTTEVQKQIDELTAQLNIGTAALKDEIDQQTKKEN